MKYVLIVMWVIGSGNKGVAMQEFDSLETCQNAAKMIHAAGRVLTTCERK